MDIAPREIGEMMEVGVAILTIGQTEVDGLSIDAHRRAGLHASHFEAYFCELFGEAIARQFSTTTARNHSASNVHKAIEESAGSKHHRLGLEANTHLRDGPLDAGMIFAEKELRYRILPDEKVGGVLEHIAPSPDESSAIGLTSWAPHGRALRTVEHAELNGAAIGDDTHHAAQRINLAHNLALGNAADRGIARHLGNLVHIHRDQTRAHTQAGRSMCSLTSGVSASNHKDIVFKSHSTFN